MLHTLKYCEDVTVLYSLKISRVKNFVVQWFPYFCDKNFTVLQVTNNTQPRWPHTLQLPLIWRRTIFRSLPNKIGSCQHRIPKMLITNNTISLNKRLKISFKRRLWSTKIFKARQKFSKSSKFFTLKNFRLYNIIMYIQWCHEEVLTHH